MEIVAVFLVLLFVGLMLWVLIWSFISFSKFGGIDERISGLVEENLTLRSELGKLRDRLARHEEAARAVSTSALQPAAPPQPAPLPVTPAPQVFSAVAVQAVVSPPEPPPVASVPAPVIAPPQTQPPALPQAVFQNAPGQPPLVQVVASSAVPAAAATHQAPPPPPVVPQTPPAPESAFNWEVFMGARMLSWIAGVAAFFGIALFVKLSIENNWITPEMRVALGYLAATGMLVGGLWFAARKGMEVLSHALCGAGIVSLYAVTLAAHKFYHFPFFGLVPTFALMTLVTVAAFTIATRLRAQAVALLGLLGGFLTPLLLSTGVDNPFALFTYLALLDLGLIAVALYCRWHYMVALAVAATGAMQLGWVGTFFGPAKFDALFWIFLVFPALFLGVAEASRRLRRDCAWLEFPAAAQACLTLLICFFLLGYPALLTPPVDVLALLLLADLALLVLSVRCPRLCSAHLLAGAAVFTWLACWLLRVQGDAWLGWQLGAVFAFAVLHVAFPLVMSRLRPGFSSGSVLQWFPVAGLAVALIPTLILPEVPFLLWPALLALDLLAITLAVLAGAMVGLSLALLLTLVGIGIFIAGGHAAVHAGDALGFGVSHGLPFVLLIGFFGLLFCGASWLLLRRQARQSAEEGEGASTPFSSLDMDLLPHMPALSAMLPFALLTMLVMRLELAAPHAVFGLAFLLSILLLGLSALLAAGLLPLFTLAAVGVLQAAWLGNGISEANALGSLLWVLAFYVLFTVQAFVGRSRTPGLVQPWVAAALAGPLQALFAFLIIRRFWPNDAMGLVPLAFALTSLVALAACLRLLNSSDPRRLPVLALFGGITLLFVTAIFPVQFDRQWITISWAMEGAALLWLYHRVPHPGLRIVAVGLFMATFLRLALNPAILEYHLRGDMPVLNWYLYTYGLAIASLFVGAAQLRPAPQQVLGSVPAPWLQGMGVVLGFILLNIEIADFFTEPGQALHLDFSGNFARDMSYTVGWSLFALGLLVAGLVRRVAGIRRAALALMGIAILKLFLKDLASIGDIYRVIAFIATAVILFVATFLYQRFLRASQAGAGTAQSK